MLTVSFFDLRAFLFTIILWFFSKLAIVIPSVPKHCRSEAQGIVQDFMFLCLMPVLSISVSVILLYSPSARSLAFHLLLTEAAQLESALTTHAPLAWMLAVADGHFEQERNEL